MKQPIPKKWRMVVHPPEARRPIIFPVRGDYELRTALLSAFPFEFGKKGAKKK